MNTAEHWPAKPADAVFVFASSANGARQAKIAPDAEQAKKNKRRGECFLAQRLIYCGGRRSIG